MKAAKGFTLFNYIFSSILYIFAILTLVFKLMGYWVPWNLAGYGFVLILPIAAFFNIFALVFSVVGGTGRLIRSNLIMLILSIAVFAFTAFGSMTWSW